MTAVGQSCLALGLGEFEPTPEQSAKFALRELYPVHNMQIMKPLPVDVAKLQEVSKLYDLTQTCMPSECVGVCFALC